MDRKLVTEYFEPYRVLLHIFQGLWITVLRNVSVCGRWNLTPRNVNILCAFHLSGTLGVWENQLYKTSCVSLPAKQAITVGSSLGFNTKLLHDQSNFNLLKLMPRRKQTFLLARCRWGTFREEERLDSATEIPN